jgi:hypothetical protein
MFTRISAQSWILEVKIRGCSKYLITRSTCYCSFKVNWDPFPLCRILFYLKPAFRIVPGISFRSRYSKCVEDDHVRLPQEHFPYLNIPTQNPRGSSLGVTCCLLLEKSPRSFFGNLLSVAKLHRKQIHIHRSL